MKLQWKVAIITGAASGIGANAARRFAEEGATVVCVDVDHHGANAVANEITAAGGRAKALDVDVSDEDSARRMVETAVEDFGRLDVLFNNAGVRLDGDGDAETTPVEVWDRTFAANVRGVWLGCKYGIPAMRDTGGGAIINTASHAALVGGSLPQVAYVASKGAVLALTRELAARHAGEGIRVNALCPGLVTGATAGVDAPIASVPMGRAGDADEVARAALFLATDDASYITGATFTVDGGLTAT